MLKSLILTVAASLALTMSSVGAAEKPDKAAKEQYIKAEVRGTLHFESGRGYYIAVKPTDKADQEMRIWLWISEDKVLVRQLRELDGKQVIAKGELGQLPEGHKASVPPLGMYMGRFEINEVVR
jgi:uncharacterized protein YpmB